MEQTTDGWVQLDKVITQGDEEGQYISTFTNTLTRDFTVEKKWNPADQTRKPAVTLGLYRTTNANDVNTTKGTPVPVDEMDSNKGIRTVVLDGTVDTGSGLEKTAWHATFTALPQYDKDSNLYYYYAMELDADGNPIANGSVITLDGTGYVVSYAATDGKTTAVTNTPAIGLTGTKTWKDDSNKDGDRPPSLTLILERKIATQTSWDEVTGVTPTWTDTDTDTWTYSFTDLPQYAPDGSIYTYRVRESVPGGYKLENQSGTEDGAVAADRNGHYHFANVRIGTVTLHVTKKWTEGAAANRPADIQLKLERKTVNQADNAWTDVTNMYQSSEWVTGSDTWTLTYDNLPQFNGSGVRYEYRITEDGVPVDYEVKNGTNTDPTKPYELENIQKGALEISKEVSGNRGETERAFHFTITLTGTSLAGTKADDVTGRYTAVYTLQGDTTVHTTTIAFTNGKSAEFTLKHDESLTIQGLPAGLSYQVVETEENQDGYSTHGSGWNGNIPVGDTAQAAFENYRNSSPSNQTNISGTKTWIDDNNADGTRPASIELILYRSVDGGAETEVSATPVWTKDGNVWTYRYTGLPKYDGSGKTYTYRVSEVVPDGYQAQYDGLNIVNRKEDPGAFGSLRISKQVVGEKADRNREFSFKVTLSDKTISGTYGDLTFTEGVATFTLKHGQSLTATGLPAGLTYKVDEIAVEGYTIDVVNPTGVIAGEGMVEVRFTNTWEPGEDPDPDPDDPDDGPDDPGDKPDDPDDKPDKPDSNTPDDGDKGGGVRTGDTAHPGLLAALTALFAGGLLLMLHLGRKRRNGKKNG